MQTNKFAVPKKYLDNIDVQPGDTFEAHFVNDMVYFVPVAVYPQKFLDELEYRSQELISAYESGEIVPRSVEYLMKELDGQV